MRFWTFEPSAGTVALGSAVLLAAVCLGIRALVNTYHAAPLRSKRKAELSLDLMFGALCATAVARLWGTWNTVAIQPDSFGYIAPAAKAIYEGSWDHAAGRPFLYPAFVYATLQAGASTSVAVAIQLVAYIAGGAALYFVLRSPARVMAAGDKCPLSRTVDFTSRLISILALALYFGISNEYVGSAFYLGPESLSSVLALFALFLCIRLDDKPGLGTAGAKPLAIGAAACAAALIGLKPAFGALAIWIIVISTLTVMRLRNTITRTTLAGVLISMLALPASVQVADYLLANRYQDYWTTLFGPRTAFCNNADLIAAALEVEGSSASRLLGDAGARETATFLRDVQTRKDDWALQGFDGDRCIYDLSPRRTELENRYFGDTAREVASMYWRLIATSVMSDTGAYARRVGRQLREFFFGTPPVDCAPVARWQASGDGSSQAARLILEFTPPQVVATLPPAPLSPIICSGIHLLVGPLQATMVIVALLVIGWSTLFRPGESRLTLKYKRRFVFSLIAWVSAAIIVALAHTFDRYRYVNVTLPLFLAVFGFAGIYVTTWQLQRRSRSSSSTAIATSPTE